MIEKADHHLIDQSCEDSHCMSSNGLTLIIIFPVFLAIALGLIGFFSGNGGWLHIGALYVFGGISGVFISVAILLSRSA